MEAQPLEQLFREQFDPMVRLATLLTGHVHVAEELVMDAFVKVAPRLGDVEVPVAYLRTAVVNATRSHHRRRRTQRIHDERTMPTEPTHDPEVDELWGQLDELRPDERACVVLRFYEDLTVPQIAEQLDLPAGTVKSHLHRSLQTLRTRLDEGGRP